MRDFNGKPFSALKISPLPEEDAKTEGDDIRIRASTLLVGSCTCTTKTPVIEHHSEACRYRLVSELIDALAESRAEVERLEANLTKIVDDSVEKLTALREENKRLAIIRKNNP